MEQKQKLLRQQILQKGLDPAQFFEYWQSLGLDFEQTQFEEIKIIVQTYVQTYLKNEIKQEDDQFDDFQNADNKNLNNDNSTNHTVNQKDVYADFDWDFLMGKATSKNESISGHKKQLKKLPKQFDKKSNNNNALQLNKQPKKSEKTNNQIEDFNINLNNKVNLNLPDTNVKNIQNMNNQPPIERSITINFKSLESQVKKQKIKCLKLQQNILNYHKNVEIKIINVQQIIQEGSLMNKLWKGKNYSYTIKTICRNKNRSIGVTWEVKKKYTDFQWLKNTLQKFYPGIIIPSLPSFPKNKDKIPGQKSKLQNFLMDAYRCPELRNSKYFEVFLSYGNFSDFEGFKKNTQNILKPKEITSLLNMKGEVDLLYGQTIQEFSVGIQQFLTKSSQHLKNVKNILTEIKGFYENISNCYTKLVSVFILMSSQSCTFSDQKCFPKLTETYKQISSLISKHSTFCQEEKLNIDSYLISHFSYEKDRIDNMQSLITKRNHFVFEFSKKQPKTQSSSMFDKLTVGVSSLFGQKSESLDIPSSNYDKLNKQVGFYNNQLLNQTIRCVQGMIQSQIDHFSQYGISRIDSVDKLQKTWSQIMVQLSKLNIMEK